MQIFDPIHNFIVFTPLEEELLAHPYLERLRHIYQLGPAFHIYPGATHSRFCHTIGVMHIASEIFDAISKNLENSPYLRQVIRLGALLHDVGHYPLSHTVELFLPKHEVIVAKVFASGVFTPIFEKCASLFGKELRETVDLIRQVALGEATDIPFLSQIVADPNFGADRIDYLLRDSLYTGLNYGRIDVYHLIRSIQLNEKLELTVTPDGIASCEALILARHWMHERLYQHHRVRAVAYHYAWVIKEVLEEVQALDDLEAFMQINDHTIFVALNRFEGHKKAILDPKERVKAMKVPLKEFENLQNLAGNTNFLWVDLPLKSQDVDLEGSTVRIEKEKTCWIYTQSEKC